MDKFKPYKDGDTFTPNPNLSEKQLKSLKKSHPELFEEKHDIDIIHETKISKEITELIFEISVLKEKQELLSEKLKNKLVELIPESNYNYDRK